MEGEDRGVGPRKASALFVHPPPPPAKSVVGGGRDRLYATGTVTSRGLGAKF